MRKIDIAFLESLVADLGEIPVHVAKRMFGATNNEIRRAIGKSEILICIDGIIKESELVDSEYGQVREKELSILRATGFPLPSEVEERCREVRIKAHLEKVRQRTSRGDNADDCRDIVFPDFEHLFTVIRCSDDRWLHGLQDRLRREYSCFKKLVSTKDTQRDRLE